MSQTLLFGSLNSGELSPLLDGRVDKPFYAAGAKTSENMIPLVQGPAAQRSGTAFVKEVKNSANRTALIPFEFNVTQAYALEFGNQYMRVHKDHAVVTLASTAITAITKANPGQVTSNAHGLANGDKVFIAGVSGMIEVDNREFTVAGATANTFTIVDTTTYTAYSAGGTVAKIYEIATPYLQADLFETDGRLRLQFAQRGDVMYIVHPSYAPRKLSRTGHTAWTLALAAFTKGPFAPPNGDDTARILCAGLTGNSHSPGDTVSVQSNTAIFDANMVGQFFFMEEIYFDQIAVSPWQPASQFTNVIGTQLSNGGNVYSEVDVGLNAQTGNVPPTHTEGDAYDAPIGAGNYKKWRYLHSRWAIVQLSAFVDSKNMTGTITTYLCDGLVPASKAITGAANSGGLIRITSAAHGYNEGDYVTVAAVGGVPNANGDWKIINVTANTFDLAGSVFAGGYTAGGTAKRYTTWKWALGAFSASRGYPGAIAFHEDRLFLGQTSAEPDSWWLSESASYDSFKQRDANQITATNSFRGTLSNGQVNKIEWAISMENGLVMGTATGEHLLEPASVQSALGPDNFRTRALSGHGSRNVQPVRVGKSAFFVQRRGKKLRDLGYDANTADLIGTDLTVRAEHLTKTYALTHMAWVLEPDALLWCIRSDGSLLSFTFQNEQTVFAWGRHPVAGFSDVGHLAAPIVESVISIPSPDGLQNELWAIVNRYIDGGTKRFIEYMQPRWVQGAAIAGAVMSDAALGYNGAPVSAVSGLWHLRGETVAVLADGRIHKNVVVDASGKITLDYAASIINVGLPVRARYQTVNLEAATQSGTSQSKIKTVNEATIRLIDTVNFKYGADFTTMTRFEYATTQSLLDTALPLESGDKTVNWPGAWELQTYLCLENDLPVPFCVAAIIPEVVVVE